ncbi:glycoside hydrolase [Lasiosphaeria miniovina]|uniref:Mannan endo-1,6-alpha-mannosidase n=1 Tax=Lasiosphaeria miniovina TaxID=1954250 RepID=A0AA40AAV2_9PEZI|nr:glycoside hydrolase [Lasiosphaeria miniovina]KAK0712419.1 glycoside hydrolase [Lasiosphaeria miniovina]
MPCPGQCLTALLAVGCLLPTAQAAHYKINTRDEILASARTLAYDMMLFYKGNQTGQTPGILPGPPTEHKGDYYWWEGGALWGTMVDYWHLTGDSSYNAVTTQALLHQVGAGRDYQPVNHTASLGNDDQAFWGMSAMLAAETRFPDPPPGQPQWLALAQAVFNTQADPARRDKTCGGGLRWQIPAVNVGYDYKNTVANACFFNLGARLARYTRNDTYAAWAEHTFDWLLARRYVDTAEWRVFDGGHVGHNCTDVNRAQFSYNAALLLQGAAYMLNYTGGGAVWRRRVDGLLDGMLRDFFPGGVAYELPCESRPGGACTTDMLSFKGYVHRWLAVVTQLAPHTRGRILPVLRSSAAAAVRQCTGGRTRRRCGFYWSSGVYVDPSVDGTSGAGEAMNVLAAVSSLLIDATDAPTTNLTGGTSTGDYGGGGRRFKSKRPKPKPITTVDRVAAVMFTVGVVISNGLIWTLMMLRN